MKRESFNFFGDRGERVRDGIGYWCQSPVPTDMLDRNLGKLSFKALLWRKVAWYGKGD